MEELTITREALNKLNDKQINYCTTMSVLIDRDRVNKLRLNYERDCGKLRGFLECLVQMDVITVNEMKALYLWFYEKDRRFFEEDKNVNDKEN